MNIRHYGKLHPGVESSRYLVFPGFQGHSTPMKQQFFTYILMAIVGILGYAPTASVEAGIIDVTLTDENARYTLYTFQDGEDEFIPLDKIAQMFRLSVEIAPADKGIVLKNEDKSATFFANQETVIVDRQSYFLAVPPRNIGGVLMVPMQFVTDILPLIYEGNLVWDPAKRSLQAGLKELEILDLYATPFGDYTRIVLEISQITTYKVTERLPSRVTFDLPYSKLLVPQETIQVKSPSVEYVKLINSFGSTQVVVKLGPKFKRYQHQMLDNPARLVIDVFLPVDESAVTPTPEGENPEGIKEISLTQENGSLAPSAKQFRLQTVVIDPGHGGSDPGVALAQATDTSAVPVEKDITLQVAKLLAASLVQRFGEIKVVLTREDDHFVGAEDRTTIANNNRADVFISLHVNRAVAPAVAGFEVYVMDYGTRGLPAGNAQSQILDYVQAQYVETSKRLAQRILDAYKGGRLKSAPLFTLKGATMPAVHIEIGYSSNAGDRGKLGNEAFQQALVAAITDGLAAFKKQEEP